LGKPLPSPLIYELRWTLAFIQRQKTGDPGVLAFLRDPDKSSTSGPGHDLGLPGAPSPMNEDAEAEELIVEQTEQLPYQDGIDPKIVMRVIRRLTSGIPEDKEKARKQGTAAIFAYLCDILSIDHSAITMKHRKAKQRLFDLVR
jgi:hypothetical protein